MSPVTSHFWAPSKLATTSSAPQLLWVATAVGDGEIRNGMAYLTLMHEMEL
jgi:hypothetical protein